jgi:hypothetical protein
VGAFSGVWWVGGPLEQATNWNKQPEQRAAVPRGVGNSGLRGHVGTCHPPIIAVDKSTGSGSEKALDTLSEKASDPWWH